MEAANHAHQDMFRQWINVHATEFNAKETFSLQQMEHAYHVLNILKLTSLENIVKCPNVHLVKSSRKMVFVKLAVFILDQSKTVSSVTRIDADQMNSFKKMVLAN